MTPPSGAARAELAAARDGTIVAGLSHNALLSISGDDAVAFLHGQFTNDVQALGAGAAQWNGWCSAKGRLLATFLLVRRADEFLLMLPAEIAAAFARRLGMFVLRSKVKIADVSARWARFGIAGEAAHPAVAAIFDAAPEPMRTVELNGSICVALDERRFVAFTPAAESENLRVRLEQTGTPASTETWEWTNIRAGIPIIVAATQEAFVPQMANFDLVGGVSFRKGCYPGQEIVARTQYRGILKRRMARAHVEGDVLPKPGDPVYSAPFGDQAAGTVVQAAHSPDGGADLLVVAQIESLQAGDLRLGSPQGTPLRIVDTPALVATP
jgi:folate-binding protein YgfZ